MSSLTPNKAIKSACQTVRSALEPVHWIPILRCDNRYCTTPRCPIRTICSSRHCVRESRVSKPTHFIPCVGLFVCVFVWMCCVFLSRCTYEYERTHAQTLRQQFELKNESQSSRLAVTDIQAHTHTTSVGSMGENTNASVNSARACYNEHYRMHTHLLPLIRAHLCSSRQRQYTMAGTFDCVRSHCY